MSDDNKQADASDSGATRKLFLYGLLGLLLIALAYDYVVARPAVENAYDEIVDQSTKVNADSTAVLTNLDVRKMLGKEPSDTYKEDNGDLVEVFSWRSGLPIRTHDLFTVYRQSGENYIFSRHEKFKYESVSDFSPFGQATVVDVGDADNAAYEAEMMGGGGGGGGDGADGGGRGGRPPMEDDDPDAASDSGGGESEPEAEAPPADEDEPQSDSPESAEETEPAASAE